MALLLEHIYHALGQSLAQLLVRGLHHDADERLGARLTHQDTAGVAQLGSHRLYGGLNIGISLGNFLILHPHVDEYLRIDGHRLGQLAQRQLGADDRLQFVYVLSGA